MTDLPPIDDSPPGEPNPEGPPPPDDTAMTSAQFTAALKVATPTTVYNLGDPPPLTGASNFRVQIA